MHQGIERRPGLPPVEDTQGWHRLLAQAEEGEPGGAFKLSGSNRTERVAAQVIDAVGRRNQWLGNSPDQFLPREKPGPNPHDHLVAEQRLADLGPSGELLS